MIKEKLSKIKKSIKENADVIAAVSSIVATGIAIEYLRLRSENTTLRSNHFKYRCRQLVQLSDEDKQVIKDGGLIDYIVDGESFWLGTRDRFKD